MSYDELFEGLETSSQNRSALFDGLSQVEQEDVRGFLAWLPSQDFQKSTVSSYKTYICKALLIKYHGLDEDMTRDYKSAVKKFKAYIAIHGSAGDDVDDDETVELDD